MEAGTLPPVTLPAFVPLSQVPEPETEEIPALPGKPDALGEHDAPGEGGDEDSIGQRRLSADTAAHHLPLLASGFAPVNQISATSAPFGPLSQTGLHDGSPPLSAQGNRGPASPEPATAPGSTGEAGGSAETESPQSASETGSQGAGGGPGTEELSEEEQQQVQELKSRDREVRQHEQAHMAAAGGHARGGPSYEYTTGPDNRRYASGGEVSIDTSKVADDPEATIRKAQVIYRAALAPAEPSSQDRSVASEAKQMEAEARRELAESRTSEGAEESEGEGAESSPAEEGSAAATEEAGPVNGSHQTLGPQIEGRASSFDGATNTGAGATVAGEAGQLLNLVA